MLRDWRAALGEGSDLLLGALGFKRIEILAPAQTWLKEQQARLKAVGPPHHVVFFDLSTDQILTCYRRVLQRDERQSELRWWWVTTRIRGANEDAPNFWRAVAQHC